MKKQRLLVVDDNLSLISMIREYKGIGIYDEYPPIDRKGSQSISCNDDYNNPFLETR